MKNARLFALALTFVALFVARPAAAQPALRVQFDQRGNFVLLGNTMGYDCRAGVPAPVVGTVGACGANTGDTAPDVFWRSESPAAGQAQANNAVTGANSRSTSVLAIPAGASISYARLYWSGESVVAGTTAVLDRPGTAFTANVTADSTVTRNLGGTAQHYQSTADITALVRAQGPGAFRVAGLASVNLIDLNDNEAYLAWSMVVFYDRPADPPRNLTIYDGLDGVSGAAGSATATLTGFLVPNAGFDGRLGVIAYEGDDSIVGDSLSFGGVTLTNALNPANNFFNGTRSLLGVAVSNVGDLPQLTGGVASMTGIDLDVMDVTPQLMPLQTTVVVRATTTGDFFALGAFVTAISTLKPLFTDTVKTFTDLTSSGGIFPGDVIEYTITTHNTGSDTGVNVVLTDQIPAQLTYLPGSIRVTTGPNLGAKTDVVGDDQGEFDGATRTVRVRIGTGANAVTGGTITTADPVTTVVFRATVRAGVSGILTNQAIITAEGVAARLQGIGPAQFPSGDGTGPRVPTSFVVNACTTNADCAVADPRCNTLTMPRVCVACIADTDCNGRPATPACEPSGACGQCSATNRIACTGATPACLVATATCVGCVANSDCGGATPVCNTVAHVCRPCGADSECGGATPACEPTGACGQCSATNRTACTGATPVCNTPAGLCVGCLTNANCGGITPICNVATHVCRACASDVQCGGATPACEMSGACGQCSATNATACTGAAPVCDTVASVCVARPNVAITAPTNGSSTNNNRPPLQGTATPGSTVRVSIDGGAAVTVTVDATGNWMLTPGAALGDGPHTVTAVASDRSGNTATAMSMFTVDTRPPAVTITAPANGTTTSNTRPAITGTSEPGATVTVAIDGGAPVTVAVDAAGNWMLTPATALAIGMHTIVATARDAAGNTASAMSMFTVNTTIAIAIVTPADGSTTNSNRPAITGTTTPGATVTVTIDGGMAVTVTADATGAWSIVPSGNLAEGRHAISATAVDASGSRGTATSAFTVDTTPPVLTITAPANGSTTNNSRPAIVGMSDPNATVSVSIDGGAPVTVTADATGRWTLTPAGALSDGIHAVVATTRDAAGNTATARDAFTVDTTPPTVSITTPPSGSSTPNPQPVISGNADPGATVNVVIDGAAPVTVTADSMGHWTLTPGAPLATGPHTVTASVIDGAGNTGNATTTFRVDPTAPPLAITSPADGSSTNNPRPAITGTTTPGATVQVSIDGGMPITVVAGPTGVWSVTPPANLADGPHMVSATTRDVAGGMATAMTRFAVDTMPPMVAITAPANGSTTNNRQPAISGTADPGATVTVSIDGLTSQTVTADATGHWTLTPSAPLTDGPHMVTATARDAAGNTAIARDTFTVDSTPPTVTITTPPSGSSTPNTRPAITGTADPGATVTIVIDGGAPVMVTADGTGHWTFTPSTPLSTGPHTVTASSTDGAGNTGTARGTFTVDPSAPPLTITTPSDGSTTNNPRPPITGTTTPGAMVQVSIDGAAPVTVTADAMGNWSLTPPATLADGPHSVTATTAGTGGNTAVATTRFTVDTRAPTLTITAPANGSMTTDHRPSITGTADPGAIVTVTIDGGAPIRVVADALGNWSLLPPAALADGMHTVAAHTQSAAGNTADATSNFTVTSGGGCTTNAECAGTTPVCNTTVHMCQPCRTNADCSPLSLVCGASGACVQCTTTSPEACMGATPACSSMNTCVQCTTTDTSACRTSAAGNACLANNTCGCMRDSDCASGNTCNLANQRCEPRSNVDAGVDAGVDARSDVGADAARYTLTGDGACACSAPGVSGRGASRALFFAGIAALAIARSRRRRARRE